MRRLLLTSVSVAALMLTTPVWADTSSISTTTSGMGVLENDYVKAGVNGTSGTLGSGGNTSPGLLYDSTGTGTFNTSYDYLTPGSPFDGFAVKILDTEGGTATNYTNNNAGSQAIAGTGALTDAENSLSWSGSWTHNGGTWLITNTYVLGTTSQFIDITSQITAGSDAHKVWFARFIDPDARAASGDSSSTDNVIGYGVIPITNVAFSEALSSRYALGLYTTNTNVTAGVNNWSTEGDGYNGTVYTDSSGNQLTYGQGDDTIGLSWVWTGVSAGDIITANYAYIFGPSAFGAAETAVDSGAAGGDTSILTGELTDVGSATDAAESGGTTTAPTVIGSTSTSLTHHDASDDGKVQSVSRVQYTASTDIYSDGSVGDVTTTTENLLGYSGRIDQYERLGAISTSINRSMKTDPFKSGGAQTAWGRVWINGDYGRSFMNDGYSANTSGLGGTLQFQFRPEWRVNFGVGKTNTKLDGTDSDSKMDKLNFNIGTSYEVEKFIFNLDLGYAKNDMSAERSIGPYNNASETSGNDLIASSRVYYKLTDSIIPYAGAGVNKNKTDGFTETGWVVSSRTVEKTTDTNKYAEGGLRLQHSIDKVDLYSQAGYTTDKWLTANAGVTYNISEQTSISLDVHGDKQDDLKYVTGFLSANMKF